MSLRSSIRVLSLLLAVASLTVAVCLAGTVASAQAEAGAGWVQQSPATSPSARDGASMAFDQATGKIVLFGGSAGGTDLADTWTYDGGTWTKQSTATSPPARHGASMAFDQTTGRIVLFGGSAGGTDLADTWTYDGGTWTKQSPATSPPARHGGAMAFDQATGQVVLFGGDGGGTRLADTWTYAGGTWSQRSPSASPPARAGASMTFDLDSGRLLLFGGNGGEGFLGDTWTYHGTSWTKASPATAPGPRAEAAMTFDQTIGETILVGGNGGGHLRDVWTYEKGSWARREGAAGPPARAGASMEFDPASGQAVLFGGAGEGADLADTWTFGPPSSPRQLSLTWHEQSPEDEPFERQSAAMAFDPAIGQMVLFGGDGDGEYSTATWTYDGDNWTRQSPKTSPSLRDGAAMAYDPALGKMVLFGGTNRNGYLGETWTYDGTDWTELSPPRSPTARYGAAMAYDPATGQLILFGGRDTREEPSGTWAFDGHTWTKLQIPDGPFGRTSPGMAFDPALGKIVLFGGGPYPYLASDTWTYDAAGWTLQGYEGPEVLGASGMTFDPSSGRILLYGSNPKVGEDHIWTYDGTRWSEQDPAGGPPPSRARATFSFDPTTGRTVLFGGLREYGAQYETWTLGGPAAAPQPRPHPRPWISSPAGHLFDLGATVESSFGCSDVDGGPGIETCTDSGGASAPHGFFDTSTLGEHTYKVKAVSKDGTVGITEHDYVVKARPTITVRAPATVAPGSPITASATLSGGASPGGTLVFRVHGPNNLHCWKPVEFSSDENQVSGNGTYVMSPTYTPTAPGIYLVVAEYSGDESNLEEHSECREATNTVTVGKVTTTTELEVSPNPGRAEGWELFQAHVTGSEPSGTITFMDGSSVLRVERVDEYRGTASFYTGLSPGRHELTAVYSGDEVNPSSTSPVVEEEILKPDPPVPSEPEEPFPPNEPEEPSLPGGPEETFPPNEPEETIPPDEPEDPVIPGEAEEPAAEKPQEPPAPEPGPATTAAPIPAALAPPSISAAPAAAPTPAPSAATLDGPAPEAAVTGIAVSYRVRSSHGDRLYTFAFTGPPSAPRFRCGLDKSALVPCRSPTTYRHLSRGAHRFVVAAAAPQRVEPTPQVVRFFVGRHPR